MAAEVTGQVDIQGDSGYEIPQNKSRNLDIYLTSRGIIFHCLRSRSSLYKWISNNVTVINVVTDKVKIK